MGWGSTPEVHFVLRNYAVRYGKAKRFVLRIIIRELVGHYLIKDYHVTVKRGDVILWLPDICKDSPFNKLVDEVYGALDGSIRISIIYPNNGKKVSEFIKENMEEIKRMKLI